MAGEDGASGHIVPKRAPDLSHAAARTDERELIVFVVARRSSRVVDRSVEPEGQVGPNPVFSGVPGCPIEDTLCGSVSKFEDDGVRYGASLGWPMRRPPSS